MRDDDRIGAYVSDLLVLHEHPGPLAQGYAGAVCPLAEVREQSRLLRRELRICVVPVEEIEGAQIEEARRVLVRLWTDLGRLYVMAEYDRPGTRAVYRHLVQDGLQLGAKPRRLDASKKSKRIAAHDEDGVE